MDREPLEILAALRRTGSLRQAAKDLHKSQPALSAQIKKLENELGFTLLDRKSYRAELTERGQAVLERSRPILEGFAGLEDLAQSLREGHEPKLSLAVSALYPLDSLLKQIETFAGLFPQTELHLGLELLSGPWERLFEGQADLIIAAAPAEASLLDAAPVERVLLRRIPLVPVFGAASPLAQGRLGLAQLRRQPQILMADTAQHSPRQEPGRLEGAPHWQVASFEIMKRILLDGTGWASLPQHLVAAELDAGALIPFELGPIKRRETELFLARAQAKLPGVAGLTLWQLLLQDRDN